MTADTSDPRKTSSAGSAHVRRVGLFGGTFDPPHHGHLAAAWNVLQSLELDEVWLVVANDPWQKSGERAITPADRRLEWVRQSVEGFEGLEVSGIEIEREGASYTIETIAELHALHPDVAWSVIVGSDVAAGLDSWHRADELRDEIDVIVVSRPGADAVDPAPGWTVRHVSIPQLELSSTELRSMAAAGRSLYFLVPSGVADDIRASGIYTTSSESVDT